MLFDYRYLGNSSVNSSTTHSDMSFVPDIRDIKKRTTFQGVLHPKYAVQFREAISALHDVVVDDQRFIPKDRTEYLTWRKAKDDEMLALYMAESEELKKNIEETTKSLLALDVEIEAKRRASGTRNQAIRKYYDYLYKVNRDAWWVLDPVITIHPDSLFFECFSLDESSYGKLSCNL